MPLVERMDRVDSLDLVKPYYRNPRPEVWPSIPKGYRRALDIGCGAGAFGSWLAEGGAEVWGIELHPTVAKFAAQRLARVFVGDALAEIRTLPDSSFDLVTANDVLEHLTDPQEVLREVKRILTPGGSIVASLPNIRYWDEFLRLAWEGDFPREDSGIFDRTHLHWFTAKAIPKFFAEAGFETVSVTGVNPTLRRSFRIARTLLGTRIEDCRWLQHIVAARPAGPKPLA
jgi:2-polyprenyl-3-methyl-5-hydroxy-6-metoxy-1,4-benzoquinol methylase